MDYSEHLEFVKERLTLAEERIAQMKEERLVEEPFYAYFCDMAEFVTLVTDTCKWVQSTGYQEADLELLQKKNKELYADILPKHYARSYGNPDYAVKMLGEYGQILSFLYTRLREMIPLAYEQNMEGLAIRAELFLEVYHICVSAFEEERQPDKKEIEQAVYWYMMDYSEDMAYERMENQINPERDFAKKIIMESDLSDLRYLYRFGEYVTDNEIATAKHLLSMSEEKIKLMADTYTEGYRIGFEVTNKDITKKKTVGIYYSLGFERMIRQAIENFEKIGLKATVFRAQTGVARSGYGGAFPNKQYDFDHKEDMALYLDKHYVSRRLEGLKNSYEKRKDLAAIYGGPAVVETFGEIPFAPEFKENACKLSKEQQKLSVELNSSAGSIINEYIKGEERSFTIIAFPTPEVGENHGEIFDQIVRINTLDYKLYQGIQQTIIDCLDKADHVVLRGMNGNKTNLCVKLHELQNPEQESNFENCVADVNIPVGEVFTSPLLKGTTGLLHVSRVFLHELEYKELEVEFKDGMVADYNCSNFETEEENKKYIKDNLLYHHDSLPMGEFAIGTNTTAYVVAKEYDIADKLPILIAEKMGPHFAVGDTCYSHAEDVKVYNPDGKELIARENEVSALRKEDVSKAYFNCHTDITIPYDELGSLVAVTKEGEEIAIIENGRFVLAGCEQLNEPFENS